MTVRQLTEMTWIEVREAAATSVAVLPIGSQEQHSSHLPMGTDQLLVEGVLDEALQRLPPDGPDVVRLPALPYGLSPHHAFAAAITLTAQTMTTVLDEVLDSLVSTGFRRIFLVNGHGGNEEVMRLAVKRLALRSDACAGACNYWQMRPATAPVGNDDAPAGPGHAGTFETSLMLAVHPALVGEPVWQEQSAPPLFHQPPHPGLILERHGEWARVGGITDDPREATSAAGADSLDLLAGGLASGLAAFHQASVHSHGSSNPSTDRAPAPRGSTP